MSDYTDPDTESAPPLAPPDTLGGLELEPYGRPAILPSVSEFEFIWRMANDLCRSQMVPSGTAGKPADVAIILIAARDMGIPLTQAFSKLHVINGKLGLSAEMMVALVLRDGHRIWCEELTDDSCTAAGQRRGSEYVARFTFTLADAVRAELCEIGDDGRPRARDDRGRPKPWELYTRSLLWARAATGLVRMQFPDSTAGVTYTPEELGDDQWSAHPTAIADQAVREAFKARIDALDKGRREELSAAWRTWGVTKLSELTVEEIPIVEELLRKAEAIDAVSAPAPADGPESPPEEPASPETAVSDASEPDPPPPDPAENPVDTPDPTAISHEATTEGPEVFSGDTGNCADCGSPIYYEARVPAWIHCDDDDALLCPGDLAELEPAGPEIDIDALYRATHTPAVRRARVEAEVTALSQSKLLKAIADARLEATGGPKALRARLVEHRLAGDAS